MTYQPMDESWSRDQRHAGCFARRSMTIIRWADFWLRNRPGAHWRLSRMRAPDVAKLRLYRHHSFSFHFGLALYGEAVRSCPCFVDGVAIVFEHQRHSRALTNILAAFLDLGGYVAGERKQSCGIRRNHNVPPDSAS